MSHSLLFISTYRWVHIVAIASFCKYFFQSSWLWTIIYNWQNRYHHTFPDSKVYVANIGPTWGGQDPGGPHVGPMNLAIWVDTQICDINFYTYHWIMMIGCQSSSSVHGHMRKYA